MQKNGVKTAILSGGIKYLADKWAEKWNMECAIANRIVDGEDGNLKAIIESSGHAKGPIMNQLLERTKSIDGIVVETSGLALPLPLIKALNWPDIRTKVYINGVVTLVDGEALSAGSPVGDPSSLEKQRAEDPSIDHLTSVNELFEERKNFYKLLIYQMN